MRTRCIPALVVLSWVSVASASAIAQAPQAPETPVAPAQAARKLDLTFNNGRVTLIAQNVTLQEILAEWTRRGGCPFVGADKIIGGKLPPLQYDNQPELTVLESLLRTMAGYVPMPRRAGHPGASSFEAVYVLAVSRPTTTLPSSGMGNGMPVAAPLMMQPSPIDEIPPIVTIPNGNPNGQPVQQPNQPNPGTLQNQPGVYLPTFGVRSEINVAITPGGAVKVTTPPQRELVRLV